MVVQNHNNLFINHLIFSKTKVVRKSANEKFCFLRNFAASNQTKNNYE